MTRTLAAAAAAAAAATILLLAAPASAATRTADAARAPGARLSPMLRPIGTTLRPTTLRPSSQRRTRYDLSRMMARNFGAVGRRQLDLLVAASQ